LGNVWGCSGTRATTECSAGWYGSRHSESCKTVPGIHSSNGDTAMVRSEQPPSPQRRLIEMPFRRTRKDPTVSSNTRSHKLSEINFGSKNTIGRERVVCESF